MPMPVTLVAKDFLLVVVGVDTLLGPLPLVPPPPKEAEDVIVPTTSVLVPSMITVPPLVARLYVVFDTVASDPGVRVFVPPITNAEYVGGAE